MSETALPVCCRCERKIITFDGSRPTMCGNCQSETTPRRMCENGRHSFGPPPRPPVGVEPMSCQCQRLMMGYYRDNGEAFVYVVTSVEAAT